MEYIDLLALLRAYNGKGMEKVEVYGRVVRPLPRPENIFSNVKLSETGIFVEMSVFAVNLGYHQSFLRQNGINNPDNIYMVNGNLITFIEPAGKTLPEWYTISGTLRFGTKDFQNTYVGVLNYHKEGNDWEIKPCQLYDIDIAGWSRESACYYWINKSWEKGTVEHPNEVKMLPKFNSVVFRQAPIQNSLAGSLSGALNGVDVPSRPVAVKKFNKECRNTVKEPNQLFDKFTSCLYDTETARRNFLKQLSSNYQPVDDDRCLRYMVRGIQQYLKSKPNGATSSTGRALLLKYLSNFKNSSEKYISDMTAGDYLITIFDEVGEFILDNESEVTADGKAWDLCKSAFANANVFYAGIVSAVLNISYEDLLGVVYSCEEAGLDFIRVLNENPYLLSLLSNFKFDTIEYIALCFGRHDDKSLEMYKDIAMLNNFIEDVTDGSTVFTKDTIVNSNVGLVLTSAKYNMIDRTGSFVTGAVTANVDAYIRQVTSPMTYDLRSFKSVNKNQYVERMSASQVLRAVDNYKKAGLGVVLDNYITSYNLLKKELFVFETMYELAKRQYDYSHELIDKYIAEYEAIVGFKLEERQRMAVHLVTNSGFIVAGSAGSGKTTVSNCIVYVLNKLEPELDIQFAAPTGKAAKRMQEVVHKVVKTLHSKFKIGQSRVSVFAQEDEDSEYSDVAYFFDEGAMITIDLLYSVLMKIDITSSRVFLFGDFNQLPPIGKGLPFKNLLRFMPCVFLNVTKRAAEGSNITANSNYINEYSDTGNWHPLESGNDFFLLPCKSEHIQRYVYELCRFYLGKSNEANELAICQAIGGLSHLPQIANLTPDDIQVVSPLSKPTYKWGTTALNTVLQPLFNPTRAVEKTFLYKVTQDSPGSKFIIGDRVIHVDKNMYSMQWYSSYKDGHFQKIYGSGICNGEVGKVVGFYPSIDCHFYNEVEKKPDDFEYGESLRDDSTWYDDDKWFIVVEYYDYISSRNFYILYRVEVNNFVTSNEGTVFKGDDITKLNLFYAGTCHKLQGSQAKIIICPLDSVNYSGFITRQMLYTEATRGEKLVFMVGSVDNSPTSMLTRARKDIASVSTLTVGEIIV